MERHKPAGRTAGFVSNGVRQKNDQNSRRQDDQGIQKLGGFWFQ